MTHQYGYETFNKINRIISVKKIKIESKGFRFPLRKTNELVGAKIKKIKTFKDDCDYLHIEMDNGMIIQVGGDEMEAVIFKKTKN